MDMVNLGVSLYKGKRCPGEDERYYARLQKVGLPRLDGLPRSRAKTACYVEEAGMRGLCEVNVRMFPE